MKERIIKLMMYGISVEFEPMRLTSDWFWINLIKKSSGTVKAQKLKITASEEEINFTIDELGEKLFKEI